MLKEYRELVAEMSTPALIHMLGKVTQVIDPENFFMQIGTDDDMAKFCQFETDLEDFCIGKNVKDFTNPDKLFVGSLALVSTSQNGEWRRGQITRLDLDKKSADVYCVDYGTTVLVDEDNLFLDFPDFISQHPQQALKCCLAGIRPISKSWPSRAVKHFQTLTDGEVFYTVIHYNDNGTFYVSLYSQDDGLSLAHKMLQEELGVPSDYATFATFDEVKENFAQNQCYEGEYCNGFEGYYSEESAGSNMYGTPVYEDQNFNHNNGSVDVFLSVNSDSRASSRSGTSEDVDFQDPNGSVLRNFNETKTCNEETLEENPVSESSPDKIIPKFDFGPLQKTKNTSAVKIKEKLRKDTVTKLHKENIKIKEEMVEQANMAVLAGYGGLEDLDQFNEHKDYSYNKTDTTTLYTDMNQTSEYNSVQSASLNEITGMKENDLKTKNRHGSGNSDVGKSKSVSDICKNSPRNSPTRFKQSQRYIKGSRNSPVPLKLDDSEQRKLSTTTDQQNHSSTPENLLRIGTECSKQRRKIPVVTEIKSDVMQYDIYSALTKIFQEADTDGENVTRDKLQKLFSTDMYMFLEKEQISDIITLVLNRAIRYYGEIHDAMLEIIETLENTEDFVDCLMHGLKKMQDAYIKAHTTRSLYHTQCSKILAHICNMSVHWGERAIAIQEYVISVIEKWIIFNIKGTQTGNSVDKLHLIYLDCFEIIWKIVGTTLVKSNPELHSKLGDTCKEKLFHPDISRSYGHTHIDKSLFYRKVKEKLLEVYISCFCSHQNQEDRDTVDRDCQTERIRCFTVDVECQTDVSTTFREYQTDTSPGQDDEDFPSWSNVVKKSVLQENKMKANVYDENRLKANVKNKKTKQKSNTHELKTSYSESSVRLKTDPYNYTLKTSPNEQTLRTSPKNDNQKYLKRNTLKDPSHPTKSYSASHNLLHEKSKINKSKTSPIKGGNLAPTKGKSELTLTGIMKDMEAKYKETRSDTDLSSNQDVTPNHWDDSFSDQDVDMTNKDGMTINIEKNISEGQSLDEKKSDEPIDWWSVGDDGEKKENAKNTTVKNPADNMTSSVEVDKSIDQNENVVKSNYATKNNIYIDDDNDYDPYNDFDDLDYATFSNEEDEEDFGDSRVKYNQNHKENENPSSTEESSTTKPKTSYLKPTAPSWKPGQRKCTICGETTHLIYNCPDKFKEGGLFL
ncbi:hypothetical protein KUTeg_005231 [Tegillarca granosa]|uniref:Tudor domain-containing protein n=1 Tax=Tegillarca granosa TaxID=220873 RepID=A0ABQ9FL37_TEGGR|nr:hypothetical protein KUTeg_005231 [Tegillarca granosa]